MEKLGIEPATPGLQDWWRKKQHFCGFPGLRYVFFITGTPKGSPKVEKPGIEPSTPGLQDIDLSPTPRRLLARLVELYFRRIYWISIV